MALLQRLAAEGHKVILSQLQFAMQENTSPNRTEEIINLPKPKPKKLIIHVPTAGPLFQIYPLEKSLSALLNGQGLHPHDLDPQS